MNVVTLLKEIEPIPYQRRIARMIALGRDARTNAGIAAVLRELAQGATYQRMLAIYSCYTWRDETTIASGTQDDSALVRAIAIELACRYLPDDRLRPVIAGASLRQQRTFVIRLMRARRRALVGELFLADPSAHAWMVPFCPPDVVAAHLPPLLPTLGANDIASLARSYPSLLGTALSTWAAEQPAPDARVQWLMRATLPVLGERAPDVALGLLPAALRHMTLADMPIAALARHRPRELAALLRDAGQRPNSLPMSFPARLPAEDVLALLERGLLFHPAQWFPRLAPAARSSVYAAGRLAWRDTESRLPADLVAALPEALRHEEARRMVQLPVVRTSPASLGEYARLLPWEEAQPLLARLIASPDPDDRQQALPALIATARYQPEHLADALALATARRNEQDPVRNMMIQALHNLPPSRWQSEHLPTIGQIIRDALNAADCSAGTSRWLMLWMLRLLPFQPEWAAQQLATLVRERGWLTTTRLDHRTTKAQTQHIAQSLLPVLTAWEPRERSIALLQVARMFGDHLPSFAALLAMVERLTGDAQQGVAAQALGVLAAHAPERMPTLIPELLKKDASWITQPAVLMFVHRHRQDLLTPLLGQTPLKGRFVSGKTRLVLPVRNGFFRWTPTQQRIFGDVLAEAIADEQRDSPALFAMIQQLGGLLFLLPTRLVALAALNNPRPAARDVALRALGRYDGAQSLPPLIDALGDDRARIAIYALRRRLLAMPPERALTLLDAVPLTRVTVAKEVIRLIGELPIDAAYQRLLDYHRRDLHRDVRVALLRAFWDHLDQDATWPVLHQAATSDDPAIARGVISIPAERASATTQRRLLELLALLLHHPDERVRLLTLQRCVALPVADTGRVLAPGILVALQSPTPVLIENAASALMSTYSGTDLPTVEQAFTALLGRRRALLLATQRLLSGLEYRPNLRPAAEQVLAVLARDPLTAPLQVQLGALALPWPAFGNLLRQLAAAGLLHADTHAALAEYCTDGSFYRAAGVLRRPDWQGLNELERALAAEPDPVLRRVGVLLLHTLAQQHGWAEARLDALRQYRADVAPLVAGAAQFIILADD